MPDYRRYRVPGGTYFFTVNLLERRLDTLVQRYRCVARGGASYETGTSVPYRCLGGVAGSYALCMDSTTG